MREIFKVKRVSVNSDKYKLWKKQNGLCWICNEKLFLDVRYPKERCCTIEHLTPLSRGGLNVFSNKLLTHYECNKKRGNPDVKINQQDALLMMKFSFIKREQTYEESIGKDNEK